MSEFAVNEFVEQVSNGEVTLKQEELRFLDKWICNQLAGYKLNTEELHGFGEKYAKKGNITDRYVSVLTALRKLFWAKEYDVPAMSMEGAILFLKANKLIA